MKITINSRQLKTLIIGSIRNFSYIEVITLTHNAIEIYLREKIESYISKIDKKDINENKTKNGILKEDRDYLNLLVNLKMCYLLNLINHNTYLQVIFFNKNRNHVIHRLLKSKPKGQVFFNEIIETAKMGCKLQAILEPEDSESKNINILQYWDKKMSDQEYSELFDETFNS